MFARGWRGRLGRGNRRRRKLARIVTSLARIRAVSRRGPVPQPVRLQVADLVLDPATHDVKRGNRHISLTRTEYRLLEFLMRRPGVVMPRAAIIDAIWGFDESVENNTLDAFIKLLRGKIENGNRSKLIHTVRGFGYCLRDAPGT